MQINHDQETHLLLNSKLSKCYLIVIHILSLPVYLKRQTQFLPVGRTIAVHKMIGSDQKSFMEVDVWPKQKLIIVRKPSRTVVSHCFIPFPNNWQICWCNIKLDLLLFNKLLFKEGKSNFFVFIADLPICNKQIAAVILQQVKNCIQVM